MDRKWSSGASGSPPALTNASDGFPTEGNPGLGTPATKPGAHWFYSVTEELLSVIAAAGITPDKTSITQLRDAISAISAEQSTPGGRLTGLSGSPVPATDVTNVTTIYYSPYVSDRIQLYNGTSWLSTTFTELSQTLADSTKSPSAAAADKNYDMFVWNDSGTIRCTRGPTWDTGSGSNLVRGTGAGSTELELFNGRYVNKFAITNGPAARRGHYVGSIATNASTQVNDNILKRQIWNNYNRVNRQLVRNEAAGASSWTYNTNAYRAANNNISNSVELIMGLAQDLIQVEVFANAATSSATSVLACIGIGINSTTSSSAQIFTPGNAGPSNPGTNSTHIAGLKVVAQGRYVYTWVENGLGSAGTTTWFGSNSNQNSGMYASAFF